MAVLWRWNQARRSDTAAACLDQLARALMFIPMSAVAGIFSATRYSWPRRVDASSRFFQRRYVASRRDASRSVVSRRGHTSAYTWTDTLLCHATWYWLLVIPLARFRTFLWRVSRSSVRMLALSPPWYNLVKWKYERAFVLRLATACRIGNQISDCSSKNAPKTLVPLLFRDSVHLLRKFAHVRREGIENKQTTNKFYSSYNRIFKGTLSVL